MPNWRMNDSSPVGGLGRGRDAADAVVGVFRDEREDVGGLERGITYLTAPRHNRKGGFFPRKKRAGRAR